ncbi:MAG: DUF1538 family protein [Bacillota bacterium]|jgi:nitrogen regulatory protein PII
MSLLFEKTREVTRTLLLVVTLVMLLCLTVVQVDSDTIVRFLVASGLLLIGLSIFLWGVDIAMNPIGEYMSREVATSTTPLKVVVLSFLMGFLVTVAEPDLLILGSQVNSASGGVVSSFVIVYMVSVGVGIMITLGVIRLLADIPYNGFMAIAYGVILVLALFVSEEFLAIAFDASGATTGSFTTPFILALSVGLSRVKGGVRSEENSFGLVGAMSAGPIMAVVLVSLISRQKHIQGEAAEFVAAEGILQPILNALGPSFLEALAALLPISLLFFGYNFAKFKIKKDELLEIVRGLILTLVGFVVFLASVNSGFMDMGRIMGMEIASISRWLLIVTGFLLGLVVVLAEPAVHVLGEQIEEVTGGHIPLTLIRATLSIGVAVAVALSMVRILVPAVKIWYFLLPGFAIAVLLSFRADPVFVGIAYDAGGVASGPMAATFVLAFAQGAATMIETADVLIDGFGVIAMVAMSPVLSIMILGTAFRHKRVEYSEVTQEGPVAPSLPESAGLQHECIMVIVNRGLAEKAVEVARRSGATGATIIHGRGTGDHEKVLLPVLRVELQPEKEIVVFVTDVLVSDCVEDSLLSDQDLQREGQIAVFTCPTKAFVKTFTDEKEEA